MLTVLHITAFGFVLGVSAISDKEAFAWMRGKKEILDAEKIHLYHRLVWLGLSVLIVSGVILMYPMRVYLLSQLFFVMKLLFVGVLIVNGVLIGRMSSLATEKPFASLTSHEKMALLASGVISSLSWMCVAGLAILVFEF
jgi:hypothetical protein